VDIFSTGKIATLEFDQGVDMKIAKLEFDEVKILFHGKNCHS